MAHIAAAAVPSVVSAPEEVQPFKLQARASLVGAVSLKWNTPDPTADISYTLQWLDGAVFKDIKTDIATNFYRIDSLESGTSYTFRVKVNKTDIFADVIVETNDAGILFNIMPLGDSNTEGGGSAIAPNGRIGYRKKLYGELVLDGREEGYRVDFVGSVAMGQDYSEAFKQEYGFEIDVDNAGFGGARDEDIALLLKEGRFPFYNTGEYRGPGGGFYLDKYNPDIILLHIGTNQLDGSANSIQDVVDILDQIDLYEERANKEVTVVLAKIILTAGENKDPVDLDEATKAYNEYVREMAEARVGATGDRIVFADMNYADLTYARQPAGDMYDNLHPNQNGYDKMAQEWFRALAPLLKLSPISVLPVELINFDAAHAQGKVLLKWNTASEDNNSHFEVERMQEGQDFRKIGTVAGAGNSQLRRSYTFKDAGAPVGTLYYRLKQVDHDGMYEYSKVVAIQQGRNGELQPKLYPNPVSGEGAVQLTAGGFSPDAAVEITFSDAFGRKLHTQTERAGATGEIYTSVQLPAALAKGMYIIQIASTTRVEQLKLLLK